MNPRTLVVLLIAIVFGGGAAAMVYLAVANQGTSTRSDKVSVVVAKEEISAGTMLTGAMLTTAPFPKELVPEDAFTNVKDLTGPNLERAARMNILKGEPIVVRKVTDDGKFGLHSLIEPGFRAFTLPVNEDAVMVGGFLQPRDKVDILVMLRSNRTREDEDEVDDGGATTSTLMQSVELLAVGGLLSANNGEEDGKKKERKRNVTLKVTPDQANVLQLASTQGELHLALRGPEDTEHEEPGVATLKNLRGFQGQAVTQEQYNEFESRMQKIEARFMQQRDAERKRLQARIDELEAHREEEKAAGNDGPRRPSVLTVHTLRGRHRGHLMLHMPTKNRDDAGPLQLERVVSGGGPNLPQVAATGLKVGQTMPNILFNSVRDEPVDLSALRGKVVLVDFWATWCGPCVAELPNVKRVYEQYREMGFEVIGISLDSNREDMMQFVETREIGWPQYFDGQQWNNAFAKRFEITSIPATFLLDKRGVIRYKNLRGEAALSRAVRNLMED